MRDSIAVFKTISVRYTYFCEVDTFDRLSYDQQKKGVYGSLVRSQQLVVIHEPPGAGTSKGISLFICCVGGV